MAAFHALHEMLTLVGWDATSELRRNHFEFQEALVVTRVGFGCGSYIEPGLLGGNTESRAWWKHPRPTSVRK